MNSLSPSTSQTPRRPRRDRTVQSTLATAYAVMEITAEAVADAPKIDHLFRPIGGRMAALRYLESSDEPEAQAVIKLYRRMPKSWVRHVPLEAYAVAVKISRMRLFGLIAQEMIDDSEKVAVLLAQARQPEVVQATIQRALKPSGVKDRRMLHKATGFLPVPNNSISMINGTHNNARSVAKVAPANGNGVAAAHGVVQRNRIAAGETRAGNDRRRRHTRSKP